MLICKTPNASLIVIQSQKREDWVPCLTCGCLDNESEAMRLVGDYQFVAPSFYLFFFSFRKIRAYRPELIAIKQLVLKSKVIVISVRDWDAYAYLITVVSHVKAPSWLEACH